MRYFLTRRTFPFIGLAAFALAACSPAPEIDLETERAEAAAAAKALGGELKSRLVAAMSDGGPEAGVFVCSQVAPEIAERASTDYGGEIGRTALRVRNPDNAPDDWERAQLQAFLAKIEAGADPAALEAYEVVDAAVGAEFRWMKPILMDGPCLTCHGPAVSENVRAAIEARYPDDEATGFDFEALRGAFTARRPLTKD